MPPTIRGQLRDHMPALDGLRAIAIIWVVLHNTDLLETTKGWSEAPIAILHDGWAGVTLFFVLSGFLITGGLIDSRGAPNFFSGFYTRRSFRILPLYYGMLLLCLAILPLFFTLPDALATTSSRQWSLWLFVANWTEPVDGGVTGFSHFWSLAIEEQFYLAWPLIVFLLPARGVLITSAVLIVAAFSIRAAAIAYGVSHDWLYMNTFSRMDALAAGAAVAALPRISMNNFDLGRVLPWAVLALCILLGAALPLSHFLSIYDVGTQTFGYSVLALFFAGIVLASALRTGLPAFVLAGLDLPALRRVARYSYGMYVIHMPLHVFITLPLLHRLLPEPDGNVVRVGYMACVLVLTFLLAALSYEFFEGPALRLGRRISAIRSH